MNDFAKIVREFEEVAVVADPIPLISQLAFILRTLQVWSSKSKNIDKSPQM